MPGADMIADWASRDTPADTIITQPYFSDLAVRVILR